MKYIKSFAALSTIGCLLLVGCGGSSSSGNVPTNSTSNPSNTTLESDQPDTNTSDESDMNENSAISTDDQFVSTMRFDASSFNSFPTEAYSGLYDFGTVEGLDIVLEVQSGAVVRANGNTIFPDGAEICFDPSVDFTDAVYTVQDVEIGSMIEIDLSAVYNRDTVTYEKLGLDSDQPFSFREVAVNIELEDADSSLGGSYIADPQDVSKGVCIKNDSNAGINVYILEVRHLSDEDRNFPIFAD